MSVAPVLHKLQEALQADPGVAASDMPQAAVLIALENLDSNPAVVLTQRASHMRLHAGEVAFPGGKCDAADQDHWSTALREAQEEIGLQPTLLQAIGIMPPLVTRTEIEVTPCVGWLAEANDFVANRSELDAVFSVPLDFLADRAQLHFNSFDYGGRVRRIPRYEWGGYSIWGITAAMLVKLVNLACDAGLEMEDYWQGR